MTPIRWSDNDNYFGPFTYGKSRHGPELAISLDSGDDDDYRGCRLRFGARRYFFIIALPAIIRPFQKKIKAIGWDDETIERLGRDWYFDTYRREYSVSLSDGTLHVRYGQQTHDSTTDKSKCYFIPWRSWRHIRHSLYDLDGELFATLPASRLGLKNSWKVREAIEDACPSTSFEFDDFDGERITASTKIEEREWLLGEGHFKWLSWFAKPKTRRSLSIEFSAETGQRKGSWKGGTIGSGIDMKPDELHEAAFKRYCAENNMTFVGQQQ